jgi:hypothetical protein
MDPPQSELRAPSVTLVRLETGAQPGNLPSTTGIAVPVMRSLLAFWGDVTIKNESAASFSHIEKNNRAGQVSHNAGNFKYETLNPELLSPEGSS